MIATHDKAWRSLQQAAKANRLSHAYLLLGAGLHKERFAQEAARWILCEHKDTSACGLCKSCVLMQAQTHPDFIAITPEQSAIKINQIRALSMQLTHKSHRGGYQVVVISHAESMPAGAANALLKTLEEPLGDVVIFLIANSSQVLPATIVSRCQQLSLDDDTPLITADTIGLRDEILHHLHALLKDELNAIKPVDQWIKQDNRVVYQLLYAIAYDIARVQWHPQVSLINQDQAMLIQAMSLRLCAMRLQTWFEKLCETMRLLHVNTNLNKQLCMEDLLIAWKQMGKQNVY
jgi:DNA polymerase III delta' subunit